METTNQFLFVYGTLLQPGNEFAGYLNTHCKFISAGKINGRLYDIGAYPGIVVDADADQFVCGSVFAVDDPDNVLAVLDEYEGISPNYPQPHEYFRELVYVNSADRLINCWVYLYNWPVNQQKQIIGGDYQQYLLKSNK